MSLVGLFVTALLLHVTVGRNLLAPSRIVAEVPVLQGCSGIQGNAIVFPAPIVRTMHGRGNYTFSGSFNITRSAQRISEVHYNVEWGTQCTVPPYTILLNFTRCRDVVSSNTCEHFHTWRLDRNACRSWMDSDAPWASLVKGFSKSYQCPTREGVYYMKDVTLDAKGLTMLNLPLEGAVWQTSISFIEPAGSLHYCLEGTTLFHRVRT